MMGKDTEEKQKSEFVSRYAQPEGTEDTASVSAARKHLEEQQRQEALRQARLRRQMQMQAAVQHPKPAVKQPYQPEEQNYYRQGETAENGPIEPHTAPEEEQPKKKKKKHFFRKLILLLLILLGTLFIIGFLASFKMNYKPYEVILKEDAYGLPAAYEKGVHNILLIGTDARSTNDDSRSDAMILCSICPLQHKIHLTSILRDSYVDIPGYGKNRINHAYQMGGARLLVQTIEQNFNIRIDNYAKVDFFTFIEIIDLIGGVDITVTAPEVHYVDAYLSEINHLLGVDPQDSFIWQEGTYRMSGKQALAYARIRYIGTDFGRTERQRTVIKAAAKQVARNPFKLIKIAGKVMENITTDLSRPAVGLLFMRAPFLLTYKFESTQIPFDGLWWNDLMPNGQDVLSMDMESTKVQLRGMVYGR